jgi:thiamine kinase
MTLGNADLRALGVVPIDVADEDIVWTRLVGGFHNDVHLVCIPSSSESESDGTARVVVKHFVADVGNPLYPQLPGDENRALVALAGTGLAPIPLAYSDDLDGRAVLVYRYVEGEMWSSGVAAVGRLLRRLHTAAVTSGFRPLPVAVEDLAVHARRIIGDVRSDPNVARVHAHIDRRVAVEGDDRAAFRTLVHTDCGPGNLVVVDDDRLVLIDWQCPGIGDPVEDLTNFVSPAIQILYDRPPLSDDDVAEFLEAYGDHGTTTRFEWKRWHYHARLAAYCAFRRAELQASRPDVARTYGHALDAELDLLDRRP